MGYSENPAMVRVDFFKESGKWYCTEAIEWTGAWCGSEKTSSLTKLPHQGIHDAFRQSLADHFSDKPRLLGMRAICLKPYHEHEHPISLEITADMRTKPIPKNNR